jgi:hypothetical protein
MTPAPLARPLPTAQTTRGARWLALAGVLTFGLGSTLACSSSHPSGGTGGSAEKDGGADTGAPDGGDDAAMTNGTPGTFNVFDALPQFGIYTSANPADYTPPAGVLMWSYGTVFLTKLDATNQAMIGADLAAKVTFIAQCDNYDRLGGLFFVVEPKGQMPQPTDPRIEIMRLITPFSDFTQGSLATLVYPDADISPYALALADTTHDVWVGLAGGSNPYSGDPCVALDAGADFAQVGFKYTVDFVSTKPLTLAPTVVLTAVSNLSETTAPITGTFTNPGAAVSGHVTVIISGHGSGAGGDEYEFTKDRLSVNGTQVGSFSTEIDCSPYAKSSPDGNPAIFQENTTTNFRNWCPGALVPSHTFPVTLNPGANTVSLGLTPSAVPSGSYYATSINFTSP